MTQLLLLRDCGAELKRVVDSTGPIECMNVPPIKVTLAPSPRITPGAGKLPLPSESTREIDGMLALRCDFDTRQSGGDSVRHFLDVLAIALQLVKPTRSFLDLWVQLDERGLPELITTPVRQIGTESG